jgi:hypothetical protein
MQINPQATLNSALIAAVLIETFGKKPPEWLRIVSALSLVISLSYSISQIPVANTQKIT